MPIVETGNTKATNVSLATAGEVHPTHLLLEVGGRSQEVESLLL